jgi:hypothetical protein
MRIFISIVSHLHHSILINLGTMQLLAQHPDITVVCRDNIATEPLVKICERYGVYYQYNVNQMGFAANNNTNFEYCKHELGMKADDFFIVLNPDIYMQEKDIEQLVLTLKQTKASFLVPNLLLDKEEMMLDDNIRSYPQFINFIQTYLFNQRVTMVDRRNGLPETASYWASGAFLIVKASLFQRVKGLEERYYMYCEDIDFSLRLRLDNIYFEYLPNLKPTHFRSRDSRRFMTKYFLWHVSSVFRYCFSRPVLISKRSCISDSLHKEDEWV